MTSKEHRVRVGRHHGGMSLFIDDAVQPFTCFKINESPDLQTLLDSAEIEIPAMAKQGVMLCWVPVFPDWKGPGDYDFTDMDTRIRTVLRLYDAHTPPGSPKAAVVIRIQAAVFTPAWHVEQAADAEGRTTNLIEFRNPWGAVVDACLAADVAKDRHATQHARHQSTLAISVGDPFWDTHAIDCLKAMVAHVRASDYAGRVYGWLPCALNTNEWFLRTFAPEATCDFSAPTQKAFRDHLRARGVDCPENPVPLPADCLASDHGEFLDPANDVSRRVEEFSLWLNDRVAQIILGFARAIRAATADSPKLIGFFYGYSLGLSRLQNLSQCGHLAVGKLLESDDIDFFCSPCEYFFRADERPFTASMVMGPFANSAASHNKLVFLEDDHRPAGVGVAGASFCTRDAWHDEMFFRSSFAQVLSHGQQLWWYSLGAKWFQAPYRHAIVNQLQRVGLEALKRDRSPVAEVAVVIDERSMSAQRCNALFHSMLLTESHGAFFPVGAPFEFFELQSFLHNEDTSRFKAIVFLNLFRVDAETLAGVEKLKSGGRTLFFCYAAGLLDDRGGRRTFSATTASALVGMSLEEAPANQPLTVWVDPGRTGLMPNGEDVRYGWLHIDVGVKPSMLAVADADAEPLGFLRSGAVGLARKRHPEWTSVFSSAPCLPTNLLRELLRRAGVHIYAEDGDVIYANRSMLAVSSSSAGVKTLALPTVGTLVDALDGSTLESDAKGRVTLTLKRHETRIFWTD
ncbi:MAG: hypothetical protein ACOX9C_02360 [Kiritimatiellia bacterium]|jgi:hypothetical protein